MSLVIEAFAECLRALTLFPGKEVSSSNPNRSVWFFFFFPIVGMFFGAMGMIVANSLGREELPFVAWFIVALWLVLSAGNHLADLCKMCNAISSSGNVNERRELLNRETVLARAAGVPVIVVVGKILAISQAAKCSPGLVPFLLFLVPVMSRYTAVLFALGAETPQAVSLRGARVSQMTLILVTSGMTLAISAIVSFSLALAILMGTLIAGLLVRIVLDKRLGMTPRLCIGAVIEMAELAGLWVPAMLACRFPMI